MILQGSPLDGGLAGQSDFNTSAQGWNMSLLRDLNDDMFATLAPAVATLAALMAVGVTGNVIICYVFLRRMRLNCQNLMLLALGFFDLLSSCVGVPAEIYDMRHYYLYESEQACKAMRFLTTLPSLASILFLLLIAGDRHNKICDPLGLQMQRRHARLAILVVVVTAVLLSGPALWLYGHRSFPTPVAGVFGHDCSVDDSFKDSWFPIVYESMFGTAFVAMVVVLVVVYGRIWSETRRHHAYMKAHASVGPVLLSEGADSTVSTDHQIAIEMVDLTSSERSLEKATPSSSSFPSPSSPSSHQTKRKRRLRFHLGHHHRRRRSVELLHDGEVENLQKHKHESKAGEENESDQSLMCEDHNVITNDSFEKYNGDVGVESSTLSPEDQRYRGILLPSSSTDEQKPGSKRGFYSRTGAQSDVDVCFNATSREGDSSISLNNGHGRASSVSLPNTARSVSGKKKTLDAASLCFGRRRLQKTRPRSGVRGDCQPPMMRSKSVQSISSTRVKKALKARRTTIIACVITVGFILSYLPHLVLILLRSMITDFEHHFGDFMLNVYNVLIRSYFVNNVINIFVYGTMNLEFREHLWRMCGRAKRPLIFEQSDG